VRSSSGSMVRAGRAPDLSTANIPFKDISAKTVGSSDRLNGIRIVLPPKGLKAVRTPLSQALQGMQLSNRSCHGIRDCGVRTRADQGTADYAIQQVITTTQPVNELVYRSDRSTAGLDRINVQLPGVQELGRGQGYPGQGGHPRVPAGRHDNSAFEAAPKRHTPLGSSVHAHPHGPPLL